MKRMEAKAKRQFVRQFAFNVSIRTDVPVSHAVAERLLRQTLKAAFLKASVTPVREG